MYHVRVDLCSKLQKISHNSSLRFQRLSKVLNYTVYQQTP
jgi:hypothetical protein